MKNAILLLAFSLFCIFSSLQAQQPPCGFDQIHQELLKNDPDYARRISESNESIRKYIEANPDMLRPGYRRNEQGRLQALYTIPIVVHVMHTGGTVGTIYNPTDAQIIGAVNYMNAVFSGTFAGMQAPVEGGGVVDMEIQFGLAQRTPSCGATNGIDRVDASSLPNYTANGVGTGGCTDLQLKDFARWDATKYYNIWVVNKIDGADGTSGQFTGGYAYFAGASANLDGTVMLATQMVSGQKTLPHELGHALNLYHTFEGSNNSSQCPGSACGGGTDQVCDTDPVSNNNVAGVYNFSCRTGANGCASPNNYTINTESNFMAYTNCYTLFTNGQKARVQAAMSLPSRASLVDPSNLALTPCGTTINFNLASSGRAESVSGTVSGCRRYTDYTYQMSIGAAPSATATATLTYSGTAVKGTDYQVTTNGNFASPSNVLTFPSGSTALQSFTVRVYDDADVESAETAIFDFTVSNGGGNASKGTTTPTLTLTISDNDMAPAGTSSGTVQIGTPTFISTTAVFNSTQLSQRAQFQYKASELTAAGISAGNLTGMQLLIQTKQSTRPFQNLAIKMAHSTIPYLVDGSVFPVSGMTTVYTNASYNTVAGWNVFTFSTPFTWDGTSNVAVEVCWDAASADAAGDQLIISANDPAATSGQGNMFFQNGINCGGSFSSVSFSGSGRKPVAQFTYSVTGTTIETVAGSTVTTHIEADSRDYFYSNNSALMVRLNNISAPLGCVATSLSAGGTTWASFSGGQRSAKVFSVTPTTNGGSANYAISLYFTNAELGGKTPGTLRIAKSTAATVAGANFSNTVLVTPTVTTLGSGTTVFTGTFTGFSLFFLVDASVTLPVNLTDFTAKLNDQKNTVVKWVTASEQNNRDFEIQVSDDGANFIPLATVASQGNSTSDQYYEYLHLKPQAGTSWYRLKQTDWDNKFKYSNIVSVTVEEQVSKPFVYPVPAANTITLNFGHITRKASIELFTTDMKIVKRETFSGLAMKKEMNISNLPAGVYFIRVSSERGTDIVRFTKE
jgi:hypothetical protein